MLATTAPAPTLDQVKLCRKCVKIGHSAGLSICRQRPDVSLREARAECGGREWVERPKAWIPETEPGPALAERVEGTVRGIRIIEIGEAEPLEYAKKRIAELETCLLVTVEAHERRVVELLQANNRMKDARVEAGSERDAWRATAEALARSLIAAQAERDAANLALQEAAREIGEQSMTLDEGTEG